MTEIEGLKRKLTSKLGANSPALVPDWQVLFLISLHLWTQNKDVINGRIDDSYH